MVNALIDYWSSRDHNNCCVLVLVAQICKLNLSILIVYYMYWLHVFYQLVCFARARVICVLANQLGSLSPSEGVLTHVEK